MIKKRLTYCVKTILHLKMESLFPKTLVENKNIHYYHIGILNLLTIVIDKLHVLQFSYDGLG